MPRAGHRRCARSRRAWPALLPALLALAAGAASPAVAAPPETPWTLALADTARTAAGIVRLRDVAAGPLPAAAGELALGQAQPGQTLRLERAEILRALVVARLAAGVRLAGAEGCVVLVGGEPVAAAAVRERAIALLQQRLPAAAPGAPEPWLELEMEVPAVATSGTWELALLPGGPLRPGRNLVGLVLEAGGRKLRLSASATCHVFGEVAVAGAAIGREQPLEAGMFLWSWRDLAGLAPGPVVGRERLAGCGAARDLPAGAELRESDLRPIPLVRRGEPVELVVSRGGVSVSVVGEARQDGQLGQLVSVRSPLRGEVVAGRVLGPGLVEWRRR